jgi:hypothetical protein
LRPWGALTQVALFGTLITAGGLGWEIKHRLDLLNDFVADPQRDALGGLAAADDRVHAWGIAYLVAYLATVVAWVTWFFIARTSAEKHNEYVLRFGRGWAIGSWFTPFLSLWRPCQMTNDILSASELPSDAPHWASRRYVLVGSWWGFFVAHNLSVRFYQGDPQSVSAFRRHSYYELVSVSLGLVAALLAILVVGRITGANDRRRTELQSAGAVSWNDLESRATVSRVSAGGFRRRRG